MTTVVLLLLALASAITLLLVSASVVTKWRRTNSEAQRRQAEQLLRPQLIEVLSADEPDLDRLLDAGDQSAHHREAIDALALGLLSKLRGSDREVLAELLQRRGAFERARRQTRSRRSARRVQAAEMLGNGADGEVIPYLTLLLDDPRGEVRKTATRSLGKTGSAEAVPLLLTALAANRAPYSVIGMALLHIGNRATGQLLPALGAPEPIVRMVAADCLGVIGAASATAGLISMDQRAMSPAEQRLVVRALGRIGSPSAVPALKLVLEGSSPVGVREEASIALGRIGDQLAHDALAATMRRPDDAASRAAAEGLRLCGDAGIDTLRALLETSGPVGALARESLSAGSRGLRLASL